ncbi:methionine aminopeptidase [Besnoitia besnoiti]|uniref:Methionine aminopeptidase n=1 Tax=Besnoitia besnoiti TaxID=94643 RepID=A0A2A9MJH6_BESBE|nr:methionine aminopeptidase [Besnoitia besnoiti]PFH38125.1 methionine aminopeptidase [Besnoitia besnoiti]
MDVTSSLSSLSASGEDGREEEAEEDGESEGEEEEEKDFCWGDDGKETTGQDSAPSAKGPPVCNEFLEEGTVSSAALACLISRPSLFLLPSVKLSLSVSIRLSRVVLFLSLALGWVSFHCAVAGAPASSAFPPLSCSSPPHLFSSASLAVAVYCPDAMETTSSSAAEDSAQVKCEGCGKLVKPELACPTCVKLGIKGSYFCSQACFRASWKRHKDVHEVFRMLQKHQGETCAVANYDPHNRAAWRNNAHLSNFLSFSFTGPLRPWPIRERMRTVPAHIPQPDYALTGVPQSELDSKRKSNVHVHSPEELQRLREACLLGRRALDLAHSLVKPGVTTEEIDAKVHAFIVENGGYPSPLNYQQFPKSCCTSVNEVICHGIPDLRPLEEGDIVNVDVTVFYKGMHGDLNETYFVGEVDADSKRLVEGAYECLMAAVKQCRPGMMYREIGRIVSDVADKHNLSVVKSYCGHGIGELFHTTPNIPHYRKNKAIGVMKPGHVFTIEPMINLGKSGDVLWPDNWTACTIDGKRSAQFEHTLVVTEEGVEVLTKRLESSPPLEFDSAPYDLA